VRVRTRRPTLAPNDLCFLIVDESAVAILHREPHFDQRCHARRQLRQSDRESKQRMLFVHLTALQFPVIPTQDRSPKQTVLPQEQSEPSDPPPSTRVKRVPSVREKHAPPIVEQSEQDRIARPVDHHEPPSVLGVVANAQRCGAGIADEKLTDSVLRIAMTTGAARAAQADGGHRAIVHERRGGRKAVIGFAA
jgi:hypothetical protein